MINIEYLRQFKVGGFAVFDFVVSFLGIYLLSPLLTKMFLKIGIKIPRRAWMYLTLPISIITHIIVGNITPMTEAFIDLHGSYILKIIIVGLLVLGIKDIRCKR